MPLVRIDAFQASSDRLDALGRALHDALVEAMGFPPNDLFQVLTSHDGVNSTLRYDNYLGISRDEDVVYVAITLRSGRESAQKQALYRRIAELAYEYAGTQPRNVLITLTENKSIDWSFGYGRAQYAQSAAPRAECSSPPTGPDDQSQLTLRGAAQSF